MVWPLASCSAIRLLQYSRFWSVIHSRCRTSARSGRVDHQTLTLSELKVALRHHLAKNRLANVWANKERWQQVLEGRSGRVVGNLRQFIVEVLGNPTVTDAAMQAKWSSLMAELARVSGLGVQLATVSEVCGKIESCGAPSYAAALRQPFAGTVDVLLPDNWRAAWRLKRLSTYLESIDAQEELTKSWRVPAMSSKRNWPAPIVM